MLTILWAVLGLLVFALLVLAIPVHLVQNAEMGQFSRFRLRLRFFGGMTPWLRIVDMARPVRKAALSRAPARREEPGPRQQFGNHAGHRWGIQNERTWRLIRALPAFLRQVYRRVHVERFIVEGDLGLGDPADTGRLFAYIMPLSHALRLPQTRNTLRPDFNGVRAEDQAGAGVHIVPLALLPPALRLGWRTDVAGA